jgi:pimeloyl-ACP methyl ester carboxylesterase
MTDWFSGDVQTNGIKMHYYRTGGDKSPLVVSHGATDDGLCWTRVTRALEMDFDVIMPDARGHGLSDAPESGYTSADHAADLAGLIRALGLERPAVAGHSMGAATTLCLVANEPTIARSAILEDPPFWVGDGPPAVPGRESPRDAIRRMVEEAQASGREAAMARGRAASPTWAEEEFAPWAEAKLRVSKHFINELRPRGQEWRSQLPLVTCPLLLVTSDPDRGGIVTPETAEAAVQLQPSLRVVRLSGAGHNIRREQFEAFISTVREFLAATAPVGSRATAAE